MSNSLFELLEDTIPPPEDAGSITSSRAGESDAERSYLPRYMTPDTVARIAGYPDPIRLRKLAFRPDPTRNEKFVQIENLVPFVNLQHLDVSHNALTRIEGLEGLSRLSVLNLSFNRISAISGIPSSVVELDLSNNRIRSIPASVSVLTRLRVLRLANNRFDNIPDVINLRGVLGLQVLDLYGNALSASSAYPLLVIAALPSLDVLDGESITEDQRTSGSERFSQQLVERELFEKIASLEQELANTRTIASARLSELTQLSDKLQQQDADLFRVSESERNARMMIEQLSRERASRWKPSFEDSNQFAEISDAEFGTSTIVREFGTQIGSGISRSIGISTTRFVEDGAVQCSLLVSDSEIRDASSAPTALDANEEPVSYDQDEEVQLLRTMVDSLRSQLQDKENSLVLSEGDSDAERSFVLEKAHYEDELLALSRELDQVTQIFAKSSTARELEFMALADEWRLRWSRTRKECSLLRQRLGMHPSDVVDFSEADAIPLSLPPPPLSTSESWTMTYSAEHSSLGCQTASLLSTAGSLRSIGTATDTQVPWTSITTQTFDPQCSSSAAQTASVLSKDAFTKAESAFTVSVGTFTDHNSNPLLEIVGMQADTITREICSVSADDCAPPSGQASGKVPTAILLNIHSDPILSHAGTQTYLPLVRETDSQTAAAGAVVSASPSANREIPSFELVQRIDQDIQASPASCSVASLASATLLSEASQTDLLEARVLRPSSPVAVEFSAHWENNPDHETSSQTETGGQHTTLRSSSPVEFGFESTISTVTTFSSQTQTEHPKSVIRTSSPVFVEFVPAAFPPPVPLCSSSTQTEGDYSREMRPSSPVRVESASQTSAAASSERKISIWSTATQTRSVSVLEEAAAQRTSLPLLSVGVNTASIRTSSQGSSAPDPPIIIQSTLSQTSGLAVKNVSTSTPCRPSVSLAEEETIVGFSSTAVAGDPLLLVVPPKPLCVSRASQYFAVTDSVSSQTRDCHAVDASSLTDSPQVLSWTAQTDIFCLLRSGVSTLTEQICTANVATLANFSGPSLVSSSTMTNSTVFTDASCGVCPSVKQGGTNTEVRRSSDASCLTDMSLEPLFHTIFSSAPALAKLIPTFDANSRSGEYILSVLLSHYCAILDDLAIVSRAYEDKRRMIHDFDDEIASSREVLQRLVDTITLAREELAILENEAFTVRRRLQEEERYLCERQNVVEQEEDALRRVVQMRRQLEMQKESVADAHSQVCMSDLGAVAELGTQAQSVRIDAGMQSSRPVSMEDCVVQTIRVAGCDQVVQCSDPSRLLSPASTQTLRMETSDASSMFQVPACEATSQTTIARSCDGACQASIRADASDVGLQVDGPRLRDQNAQRVSDVSSPVAQRTVPWTATPAVSETPIKPASHDWTTPLHVPMSHASTMHSVAGSRRPSPGRMYSPGSKPRLREEVFLLVDSHPVSEPALGGDRNMVDRSTESDSASASASSSSYVRHVHHYHYEPPRPSVTVLPSSWMYED
eukprot:ANDGO_03787.mRNA.1 Dynein regulatory complex subunit 3